MEKPISLIRDELHRKIATVINQSGLAPFIVIPILTDVLNQCKVAEQRQFEMDKAAYEKAQAEEGKES